MSGSRTTSTARFKDRDKGLVFTALGRALSAGLSPERALEAIIEPGTGPVTAALRRAKSTVTKAGRPLSQALAGVGFLGPADAAMAASAEVTGRTDVAFERLGRYYETRHLRHHKLKSRSLYPALLFVLALFISPLPKLVSGEITLGGYLLHALLMLALVGATGYLVVRICTWLRHSGWPRELFAACSFLPIIGPITVLENRLGFYQQTGLMLGAGVPPMEAAAVFQKSAQGSLHRLGAVQLNRSLGRGESVASGLLASGFVDQQHDHPLLAAAEAAGRIEDCLERLSTHYERELDDWYKMLSVWLPFVVYGVVVAFVISGML